MMRAVSLGLMPRPIESAKDDVAGVHPFEVFELLRRHLEAYRLSFFVGYPV